jgi:hypothetical protein
VIAVSPIRAAARFVHASRAFDDAINLLDCHPRWRPFRV